MEQRRRVKSLPWSSNFLRKASSWKKLLSSQEFRTHKGAMINDCGTLHRDSPLLRNVQTLHFLKRFVALFRASLLLTVWCLLLVGGLLPGGYVWNTSGRCSGGILSSCLNDLNWFISPASEKGQPSAHAKKQQIRPRHTHYGEWPVATRHYFYLFCTLFVYLFSPALCVSLHWCNSCCQGCFLDLAHQTTVECISPATNPLRKETATFFGTPSEIRTLFMGN